MQFRSMFRRIRFGAVLAWGCAAAVAAAQPAAEPIPPAGDVPLDQLLRLPAGSGSDSQVERRGGHTKSEWEKRFRDARAALTDADDQIANTRAQIEEKAAQDGGGAWRMGAPGLGNIENNTGDAPDSPLDYKLTQLLRRNREELARAERALQDLEVEANLASVPDTWRALPSALELEADMAPQ